METKSVPFDLKDVKVMLGMPCGRDLPWQTVEALLGTTLALTRRGLSFQVKMTAGSSIIESARTNITHEFLKSDCTHLFMLDSDMVWGPADIIRLLCLCTKMDVVCGAYTAKADPPMFLLGDQDFNDLEMNDCGCVKINGMGLGFTVVKREVITRLAENAPKLTFSFSPEPVPHIFRCDSHNGAFRGEDIAFFEDVRNLGYTVWMDPTVRLGHVGSKMFTGSFMDMLKEKKADE